MIHPHTELRKVNDTIGYGVFATAFIPCGTIVYVKDPLEIEVSAARYRRLKPAYRGVVEKYSYCDERGVHIISWDIAKYVNHSCECNTMSTGYGFEIAVRDILAGEEMTDEYGLLNLHSPMRCCCGKPLCRGVVRPDDIERYAPVWDGQLQAVLPRIPMVSQPLMDFVNRAVRRDLMRYLSGQATYRSVRFLQVAARTETAVRPEIEIVAVPAVAVSKRGAARRLRAVR